MAITERTSTEPTFTSETSDTTGRPERRSPPDLLQRLHDSFTSIGRAIIQDAVIIDPLADVKEFHIVRHAETLPRPLGADGDGSYFYLRAAVADGSNLTEGPVSIIVSPSSHNSTGRKLTGETRYTVDETGVYGMHDAALSHHPASARLTTEVEALLGRLEAEETSPAPAHLPITITPVDNRGEYL